MTRVDLGSESCLLFCEGKDCGVQLTETAKSNLNRICKRCYGQMGLLEKVRRLSGMTQADVAKALAVSQTTISKYEKPGIRMPLNLSNRINMVMAKEVKRLSGIESIGRQTKTINQSVDREKTTVFRSMGRGNMGQSVSILN